MAMCEACEKLKGAAILAVAGEAAHVERRVLDFFESALLP